jgi:hypothetical protein
VSGFDLIKKYRPNCSSSVEAYFFTVSYKTFLPHKQNALVRFLLKSEKFFASVFGNRHFRIEMIIITERMGCRTGGGTETDHRFAAALVL